MFEKFGYGLMIYRREIEQRVFDLLNWKMKNKIHQVSKRGIVS
jgi:hypothetical protein